MDETDDGVHRLRWLVLGGMMATAFWLWRQRGTLAGRHVPVSVRELRGSLATLIDDRGRRWGEKLSERTHTWSERLRTNGHSRRIPVEGTE
ncbi:MAG: hypothetical protein H7338_03735 [Candidatus Sericytochromatia bacterium]|nr:hypothetical protein [Candidatus Sericytochromatia bacterium]